MQAVAVDSFGYAGKFRCLDIMHPGREVGIGIDLIWQYCESDIPGAARPIRQCLLITPKW
jgi:hypothetical protein